MILDDVKTLQIIPNIDLQDIELTAIKLALVVPEASINYMRNPSAEVNTNGFSSKVAPVRDNTVVAAYGQYALKITPLDTSYSQVMAVALPDDNLDPRIATSSPATISFDIYGRPGEYVTATVEYPSMLDFFNRTGTLNASQDDRNFYTYTATAGLTLQNSRIEATTLTDKARAYISSNLGTSSRYLDATFEADMRGIFTSGAIGAWPVLVLAFNSSSGGALGVRLEQGLVRILTMSVAGTETSLTTGAFTFVTGTQYNLRVAGVKQVSGDHIVNVYINNTLVIANYTVTASVTNALGGTNNGVWLTVVGAPTGVNPYWDNVIIRDNNKLATKTVKLTSDYQRVSVSFQYDRPNPRPVLFIEKLAPYTMNPFWVDAFQFEMKSYATTYFDGDFGGTWDGLPGQSSSSSSAVQEGGKIVGLNDLFIRVTDIQGFGMPPVVNQSIPMVSSGGEIYQGTLAGKRLKNIICVVNGLNQQDLSRKMRAIENCFSPDALTGLGRPTKLYYQIVDPITGTARSALLQSSVKYRAGLEGARRNDFQEKFALQLEAFQTPDITEVYPESVALANNPSSSGINLNTNLLRNNGSWQTLTGYGGGVYAKTTYIDRRGAFWYGSTNGLVIQEYTGGSTLYPALTVTGGAAVVNAFCLLPDGTMLVGGDFTSPFPYLLKCAPGGTWAQVSATINGAVNCIAALSSSGSSAYLVGGNFTLPSPYMLIIFPGSPGAPTTIVGGLNAQVRDIVVLPDFSGFYFTGGFTTSTLVATLTRVGFYNLKTGLYSALTTTAGNGLNNSGFALALGPNNKLYIGGTFTTAGGVSISFIAAWNGTTFEAVGASAAGLDAQVTDLAYNPADGMLYAVGNFLNTGTRALTPGFAKYNGSLWLPCDIAFLPGVGVNLTSISVNANYQLLGLTAPGTGAALQSIATSFSYTGTAGANPKIVLDNSTGTTSIQIFQLANITTGKILYFNYTIAAGELLTIEITPFGVSAVSSYGIGKGFAILPGADTSSFGFQNGTNKLTFTTSDRFGSNFSAYILYRNTHWSFNGGVY